MKARLRCPLACPLASSLRWRFSPVERGFHVLSDATNCVVTSSFPLGGWR